MTTSPLGIELYIVFGLGADNDDAIETFTNKYNEDAIEKANMLSLKDAVSSPWDLYERIRLYTLAVPSNTIAYSLSNTQCCCNYCEKAIHS